MANKLMIRFGMVTLPVALDAGARPDRVSLKQLAPDGGGVKQKLVAEKTGVEVQRSELRKAWEMGKGVLVEIPADEMAALEPDPNRAIDILTFVPAGSIDPIFFEDSHYLKPQAGGEGAFALLFAALKSKGKVAIAKAFLNGAEHMVAIRPGRTGLVLQKLFFQTEVRGEREFRPDVSALPEAHLKMAESLIDAMSTESYDPSLYADEYSNKLRALIAAKCSEVDPAANTAVARASTDIMKSIMDSLAQLRPLEVEPSKPERKRRVKVVAPQPVVGLLDQIVEAHQERAA